MTLAERVKAIPYWYHRITLPEGIVTPGWAPICAERYRIPDDPTGKRVLDVGARDGYWTFEALKRGAREVVAIDDFSDLLQRGETRRSAWDTFDLCKFALGYGDDRCKRVEMPVYDVEDLGEFDVTFFFGTIYHCRYPLLALDTLQKVTREALYVESAISDDFSPYLEEKGQSGIGRGYNTRMVMEFYPKNELGQNPTNWWSPTLKCLMWMVVASGWPHVTGWKLIDQPDNAVFCRGFVRGLREAPK